MSATSLNADTLTERATGYMAELTRFPDRHVGGEGNHAATALFARLAAEFGLEVFTERFECIEWEYGDAFVQAGQESFDARVGPYSFACDLRGELVAASTVEEIESTDLRGRVLLLHGEIAATQIMPKNFTFYNPEEHQRIVRAIEQAEPAAIIAATGRDRQMVGSQYPFPLFEDGDLHVPNAYMTDVEGERVLSHVGGEVSIRLESARVPTYGEHVIATRRGTAGGDRPPRILVTAHIDSRKDSPGALDNASGVTALLLLAELLGDYAGGPDIEIVPYNGEDNYANPGEMIWLGHNRDRMQEIVFSINIDDAGQAGADNHVSFYGCPPEIDGAVREAMEGFDRHGEGPQWVQGDHTIIAMNDRPVIAIASSQIEKFMNEYAHSERDTLEIADFALIAEAAQVMRSVIEKVGAL